MKIHHTKLEGLVVVEADPKIDSRGIFTRFFCEDELSVIFGKRRILQINHSCTRNIGAIRGMHFQYPPFAEMKMIRCLKGRVWDVAVDLRGGSSTFLQWHAEELHAESGKAIVIPEGFAHGFQVMDENSELLYLHTARYVKSGEGAVKYDDPILSIRWPLPVNDISERDNNHQLIDKLFKGIKI